MKCAYQGFDKAGKAVSGTLEADSVAAAKEQLRKQGVFATRVDAGGGGPRGAGGGAVKAGQGLARGGGGWSGARLKAVSSFVRQLAVLVGTGTTVVDAITVLERQTPPGAWKNVLADLARRIEEGAQLSEAMSHHPAWFDHVAQSLVAAGESRGKLGDMLERLAALVRQQVKIRAALVGAMVYPCLLLVVAVGVVTAMIGFVLPRFEGLFQSLNAPLPPSTALLMSISKWLSTWWPAVVGGVAVVGGGGAWWIRTPGGRHALDVAMVRTPQIGRITRAFATARIARLLGVLAEGRVGLLEALELTRAATSNGLYRDLLQQAESVVTKGQPISEAFAASDLITPSVCEALRSGERTGRVGAVLVSVADYMDEDNEVVVKSLTTILEPLILIVLGLVVGAMAMSMFLPLFDLSATAGGAGGAP